MLLRANKMFSPAVFALRTPALVAFMIAVMLAYAPVRAADAMRSPSDSTCLKKADEMPDIAAAEAESWLKHGGGSAALLCRATAEFHRGDYIKSAQDFITLASAQKDARQASLLYRQAALAYERAEKYTESESQFAKALGLEKQDPDIWVDRANERAAAQKYWDAIADLNQALTIMPDMLEAVRLRGQVWVKLGIEGKAEEDFSHAAEIQAQEDVATSKIRPVTVQKP